MPRSFASVSQSFLEWQKMSAGLPPLYSPRMDGT
jgi:hypothetical protein